MKFVLIDRITELVPGERLCAVKALSLAEEYLADHFPRFPVMPGVLMLEALVQASAWLVRVTNDFSHSMFLLGDARNVTYKSFVAPGHLFDMVVEAKEISPTASSFVGTGRCGSIEVAKAKWTLRHINLAEANPDQAQLDRALVQSAKQQLSLIWKG
jgi:3-hydroxyacyl-[acyl-carrier-protein] dehydratase